MSLIIQKQTRVEIPVITNTFFFLGRCSEGSLPRGLIHVSYVREGGPFPHILDPNSSACKFLLCFSLGLELDILGSLDPK